MTLCGNNLYTSAKPFEFPAVTIAGANVADSLSNNASAIVTEKNRLDTLIDSGSALDTISELQAAWEGGDSSLSTAVDTLVATDASATTDRAAIRTEFQSADASATTDRALVRTEFATVVDALKPVLVYYVDAGRTDSYTETGSFQSPFKSLVTAMGRGAPKLLEDSSTDHVIFKLAPGDYTGVSITKASQNQTVEIHGSGSSVTNIQASAAWDATAGNVLFLRKFTAIRIRTVQFVMARTAAISAKFLLWSCRIVVFITWVLRGPTTALTFPKRTKLPTGQHAGRQAHTGVTGGQCASGRFRKLRYPIAQP